MRYADDFSIYCKTKTQAEKVKREVGKFLKTKLKLTINEEKSGIRKPVQFSLLGFCYVPTYRKGDVGKYQLTVNEKAWKRLKQSLKSISQKQQRNLYWKEGDSTKSNLAYNHYRCPTETPWLYANVRCLSRT